MSPKQRDSVGPSFAAAPTVIKEFVDAATTDLNRANVNLTFAQFLGLSNDRNFCYRNAVLTALLAPASVMRYLIRWHHQMSKDEDSKAITSIPSKLARLSAKLFGLNARRAANDTPQEIQNSVDKMAKEFWQKFCYERDAQGVSFVQASPNSWRASLLDVDGTQEFQQQDAREFLMWLMHAMPNTFTQIPNSTAPTERYDWFFKSRFVSRVSCEQCQYLVRLRKSVEPASPFLGLSIPQTPHSSSPDEKVSKFVLRDLINDAMRETVEVTCDRCKQKSNCTRERKFQHAPVLLTLVILRATNHVTGEKDTSAVVIPDQLDLSTHLNAHEFGEGSSVTYSLASVVSHAGVQIGSGHYVSYVRGGGLRNEWAELNDKVVSRKVLSDFDDSGVERLSPHDFEHRFTPYILFYERNSATDVIVPGRKAMNVAEGGDKDEKPSHWTGTKNVVIKGADDQSEYPPAVLQVTVTIGDMEIELPRHIISHLNWTKRQTIQIDAKLRVPKGKRKRGLEMPDDMGYKEAKLSDMQNEEYFHRRRQREEEGVIRKQAPKKWSDNWRDVTRESVDLTEEEVKALQFA